MDNGNIAGYAAVNSMFHENDEMRKSAVNKLKMQKCTDPAKMHAYLIIEICLIKLNKIKPS